MPARDREDLAAEIHDLGGRLTSAVSALHGLVVNECLSTETLILDGSGNAVRWWTVPFGSVAVHNTGANTLVLANQPMAGAAPASGVGVVLVPPNSAVCVNLVGRTLSLYGTIGARVVLSVFTKPQPPDWAQLGALA
jgi:hypothetical protein